MTTILPLGIAMFSFIVLGWLYWQKNRTEMHLDPNSKFHFLGDLMDFDSQSQVTFRKFQNRVKQYYNLVFPYNNVMLLIKPQKLPSRVAATFAIIYCIICFAIFYLESRAFPKSIYFVLTNFIFVSLIYKSGVMFTAWINRMNPSICWSSLKLGFSFKKTYFASIIISVWVTAAGLILIAVRTIEPGFLSLTSLILKLTLFLIFSTVIFQLYYLKQSWSSFNEMMTTALRLPFAEDIEQLPRELTAVPGNIWHFWTNSDNDDLKRRISIYLNSLPQNNPGDESELMNVGSAGNHLKIRDPKLTFGILKEWMNQRNQENASQSSFDTDPASKAGEDKKKIYLAVELVYYLNRCDDFIWAQLIALVLNCICLFFYFNSYPFQPAGTMLNWIYFLLFVSFISIIRVIIGLGSNSFFKKINSKSSGSFFQFDLLSKIASSFGPILMVLTALSFGLADILRILLGPLVR